MSDDGPALAISGSNLTGDIAFSAALRLGGDVHERSTEPGSRGDLALLVRDLCAARGVAPEALRQLVVDVGPGSYTGLRVALTFARFLHAFGAIEVFAVDSLALLAARARAFPGRTIRALLDARRGRLHTAAYRWEGARLLSCATPAALAVDAAVAGVDARDVVVLPSALDAALAGRLPATAARIVACRLTASELFAPGLPLQPADAAGLEPRYLMASYAED